MTSKAAPNRAKLAAAILLGVTAAVMPPESHAASGVDSSSFVESKVCTNVEAAWRAAAQRARSEPENRGSAIEVSAAYRRAVEAGCIDHVSARSAERQYVRDLARSIRVDERCRVHQLQLLNVASKAEKFVDARAIAEAHFDKAIASGCA